ncbi:hypothetical protein [Mycobacterium sp. Z3061]|uniref:hypothetical protein n=1 Tax=Mycobacterium sp. Z3061 TaxID=3073562 RepID=UPI002872EDA4|nr:hypothetical protein [Mycobacterium sp. Z3061]
MPDAEEVQELGRRGVAAIKQWLEATTFIELNWNVYEDPAMCVMVCADGSQKKFDLAGSFIGSRRDPVVVECKWYNSSNSQHKYFKEFLAIAYSSTIRDTKDRGADAKREYIWVTKHPFQISEWATLTTEAKIRQSVEANSALLNNEPIDDATISKLAQRVWVLVMHEKQEAISLPNHELMAVLTVLKRKESTL